MDFGSVVLGLHSLPAESDVVLPNAVLNLEVENIVEIQADIERLGGRLVELQEAHGHTYQGLADSRTLKVMDSSFGRT